MPDGRADGPTEGEAALVKDGIRVAQSEEEKEAVYRFRYEIYVAEMGGGGSASLRLGAERQAYVVCMEGACMLQEQTAQATQTQTEQTQLTRHDAAEIGLGGGGGATLGVTALAAGAHCLVVEMAADGRGGRVLKA